MKKDDDKGFIHCEALQFDMASWLVEEQVQNNPKTANTNTNLSTKRHRVKEICKENCKASFLAKLFRYAKKKNCGCVKEIRKIAAEHAESWR